MRQKVLLTGASGDVGFKTFKELLRRQKDYAVRIFSLGTKRERKLFAPFSGQVEIVWGDLRNKSDVEIAVKGVDTILHVAGIIPPAADHFPKIAREVNVGGTENILYAAQNQEINPSLVFTSSVSVYGDRTINPEIRVSDSVRPSEGDEYARTKIAAEKLIRESGIRWSVFRLCGVLVEKLEIQPLMFHMPLKTTLEWCHDGDVGYALVQAIESDTVFGKIFNLGGGEQCCITARDFLRKMFPLWGLPPDILPDYAFATRNFHSGYYADGEELNEILKFRRGTLHEYIDAMRAKISPITRFLVGSLPRPVVRSWLLKMSEPLKAIREGNENLITRFYGSRKTFDLMFDPAQISSTTI